MMVIKSNMSVNNYELEEMLAPKYMRIYRKTFMVFQNYLEKHLPTLCTDAILKLFSLSCRKHYFRHDQLDWDEHSSAGRYVRRRCKPLKVQDNIFMVVLDLQCERSPLKHFLFFFLSGIHALPRHRPSESVWPCSQDAGIWSRQKNYSWWSLAASFFWTIK